MKFVNSITAPSSTSSFVFDNIPQIGSGLLLTISARTTQAAVFSNTTLRFNDDSGANYRVVRVRGLADGIGNNAGEIGTKEVLSNQATSAMPGGAISGANALANSIGTLTIYIPTHTSSNNPKEFLIEASVPHSAVPFILDVIGGGWNSSSPITKITFETQDGVFTTSSKAALYILP